jgi:hypothetical protein
MLHYTLNSGHCRTSPRSEIAPGVTGRMAYLTRPGAHDLAAFAPRFAGYTVVVPPCEAGLLASLVAPGDAPLLALGVAADAADAEAVWPSLESLYLKVGDLPLLRSADFAAPRRPAEYPWLAVALLLLPALPDWAGDFERCLAWAWLEARAAAPGGRP